MENVVIVFPKIDDGKKIKSILMRNGIEVNAVCTSGAQALEHANTLNGGLVICSYRFTDMYYTHLNEHLPKEFEMLLIASQAHWLDDVPNNQVMKIGMPLKVFDLINTIHMMFEAQARKRRKARMMPKVRSDEEKKLLREAKGILMERNNMTEDEAHKYIQKTSMDSGNSLIETAQMVICLYHG